MFSAGHEAYTRYLLNTFDVPEQLKLCMLASLLGLPIKVRYHKDSDDPIVACLKIGDATWPLWAKDGRDYFVDTN